MRRRIWLILLVVGALALVSALASARWVGVNPPAGVAGLVGLAQANVGTLQEQLQPAEGWRVSLYAEGLGRPRLMVMTEAGDLLVSARGSDTVMRVLGDSDGDGRSDGTEPLIGGLARPHGLALRGEWLYIAEEGAILRVRFDSAAGTAVGTPQTVLSGLPSGRGHWTRTVKFGPDGLLYVTAGSSCNVCIEDRPWRAAMLRMAPDGSNVQVYATGLRNTVGFDWRPATGELYGVDNGRDLLGDGFPPEDVNRIVEGGFYGWPYFHGDNRPDPQFGSRPEAAGLDPIPPVYGMSAHTAPLSIRFLRNQADPAWNGVALIAQHGSWNRSTKIGYRVIALRWQADGGISQETFLEGFREGETVFGRPVDVLEAPDGTLFVSDDFAGAIWRLTPER